MKKFLMFAVLFVGFMIAMVAVSRKKQSMIQQVPQPQVVPETIKPPETPQVPVAPQVVTPVTPPSPAFSSAYKSGYNDGYFGTWLSPIRWTFGREYRSGWSAGNYDRQHGNKHAL